jgi:hypothetical protein
MSNIGRRKLTRPAAHVKGAVVRVPGAQASLFAVEDGLLADAYS